MIILLLCKVTFTGRKGKKKKRNDGWCFWKWMRHKKNNVSWNKERVNGAHLSQIVEVVLVMNPLVIGKQAVRLVGDVSDIQTQAVEEFSFEKLSRWNRNTKLSKSELHRLFFSFLTTLSKSGMKKKNTAMWEEKMDKSQEIKRWKIHCKDTFKSNQSGIYGVKVA